MASDPEADAAGVRRLRDALPARLAATRPAARAGSRGERDQPGHEGLEEGIDTSIRSIERVIENFGALKDKLGAYRDLVGDMRAELDDAQVRGETLERELAAMARTVEAEHDRALRAEDHARQVGEVVAQLEQRLASLQAQARRLVAAIALLTSAGLDPRDGGHAGASPPTPRRD